MAVRKISTRITLDGEEEYKRQISAVNREQKTLKTEMALTTAEFEGQANTMAALSSKGKILNKQIDQQLVKIESLEKAVEDSAKAFGDTDRRTDEYRQSLNRAKTDLIKMERELKDTERYMDEAARSTDGCAKSIDGFGREVKASEDSLGGFAGKIKDLPGKLKTIKAGLAGMAAGAAVAGIKELGDTVMEIVDSTEEYRKVMGTLETSSAAAGYTAEETSQTYKQLYEVLGDTQTAATTVANLQAIGLSQSQLTELVDMTTGAWAKYGDSIPIDGLGEAINETIKAGEVTGTFADVLNWGAHEGETYGVAMKASTKANEEWNTAVENCTTAEDYFNLALLQCQTEAERADLIMQTLANQGLAATGKAWKQNNQDIVAMNRAQDELDSAMGELGETLAPLAAGLTSLGAVAIRGVTAAINAAISAWEKLTSLFRKGANAKINVSGANINGSHADGLDYVPYDGYVAELHEGERVLTKQENRTLAKLKANAQAASGSVQHNHTGTIRVEGVNTRDEMVGVMDMLIDELRQEVRR